VENRCIRKNGACIRVRQFALGLLEPGKLSKRFVLLSLEELFSNGAASERNGLEYHAGNISSRLLDAHESERKLIAQELHDSVGACLAAIKYVLEKNLEQLQKKRGRAEISLAEVIPLVQGAIEETRRISTSLWPSVLDDLGIIATIHSLCSEFQKTYSTIRIQERVEVDEQEIPPPMKAVIYRILQEAFNNVAKHSSATLVKLSLLKQDGNIELFVEDNGCGFDHAQAMKSNEGGMGLSSMKNRVEIIGGKFVVEAHPGAGTQLHAIWHA
jgi:signal transduction histidine kinase